jgi:hypothetical protein
LWGAWLGMDSILRVGSILGIENFLGF